MLASAKEMTTSQGGGSIPKMLVTMPGQHMLRMPPLNIIQTPDRTSKEKRTSIPTKASSVGAARIRWMESVLETMNALRCVRYCLCSQIGQPDRLMFSA
jgi:hypothetical protein